MINARYTIVLKTLLDDKDVRPLIDEALSSYPLYTPQNEFAYMAIPTRDEINRKLLNHYKYREIGFETIGRFIDELEITMNEIMPYYNQLFKSEDVINGLDDIFGNVDIVEEYRETSSGTSNGISTGTSRSEDESNTTSINSSVLKGDIKNVKSSTPQGNLDIPAKNIDSVNYADEVDWNNSNSNTTSNSTNNGTNVGTSSSTNESNNTSESINEHTYKKKGNQGVNTYAHDMLEFRELMRNITNEIINDPKIQELFMMVY